MTRDIRDAWRQLRRRPILTLVAVLTLAIGTGANTAFFSLLNALLLRPLRVPAASQLVSVTESEPNGSQHGLTPRMVQALADRQSSLAAMSGYAGGGPVRITVESEEFSGGWEIGDAWVSRDARSAPGDRTLPRASRRGTSRRRRDRSLLAPAPLERSSRARPAHQPRTGRPCRSLASRPSPTKVWNSRTAPTSSFCRRATTRLRARLRIQ